MPWAAPVMMMTLSFKRMRPPLRRVADERTDQTNLRGVLSKARRPAVEQVFESRRRKTKSDKKRAEQTVNRAGFVEAHFINELFKNQRIVGKKIDAPFPIIEADG